MAQEKKSVRFNMMITPSEMAAIDEWRRKQKDLPSRSEAIRRLVALALKSQKG